MQTCNQVKQKSNAAKGPINICHFAQNPIKSQTNEWQIDEHAKTHAYLWDNSIMHKATMKHWPPEPALNRNLNFTWEQ